MDLPVIEVVPGAGDRCTVQCFTCAQARRHTLTALAIPDVPDWIDAHRLAAHTRPELALVHSA